MPTHLGNQSNHTAITTHAGTNHIQLAPSNSWTPIISNCHRQIHGYQSHPIIIATHVGTKHISTVITIYVGANQIRLLLPHVWATNHTQLPQPQLHAQTTSNWHHQTRGYQSHPIAMATHLGIKYIQLPQPHTRAPTTSNWHHEIREYQSHPIAMPTHLGNQSNQTATTTHAGTNHIQLAQPTSWVPISFNCHATHFGIKHIPTDTATHAGTNHIQLAPPNSWPPIISNCHRQIHGYQSLQ